nr:7538_t:CDS:2 [Entrophospora candida]
MRLWQQGKDLTWYSKESKNDQARKEEIRSIKEAEAEAMAELLGGGKKRKITGNVSQQELKTVLKREQEGYDDDGGGIGEEEDIKEVTKGLGFKSSGHLSIGEVELGDTEIIGAVNIPKDERKVEIKTEESIHPNLKKSAVQA